MPPPQREPSSPRLEDAPTPESRRTDTQWLRVAGMLVVFAIHAAEPFNPWDAWHIVSPERSKWLGELVLFPAPWIMPLFMVLAGEASWHALEKRSARVYVRERLVRIGLPLVAGILVLVPPQVWLERRLSGEFTGSLLAFYPRFFDGIYPQGNLSWHHLWFLVFLVAFAIVTVPLFQWLRTPRGRRIVAAVGAHCDGPAGLAWLLLPWAALRVLVGVAFAGFRPLAYDWSNRALLLPAFVVGFLFVEEPAIRRAVDRRWRRALVIATATSVAIASWAWPGAVLTRLPAPRSPAGLLLWAGYGLAAASWIVALRGGARAHRPAPSRVLEGASELAYPFYVVHHGVIVAVAFEVVQRGAPLGTQVATVSVTSLAITIGLCVVVSSSGPLRGLFGLGLRPRADLQLGHPSGRWHRARVRP